MLHLCHLKKNINFCKTERTKRLLLFHLQVLIYTEDFKSERADRERAQGQIEDLKEQVFQLKRQLHKQVRRQTGNKMEEHIFRHVHLLFFLSSSQHMSVVFSREQAGRTEMWFLCVMCT